QKPGNNPLTIQTQTAAPTTTTTTGGVSTQVECTIDDFKVSGAPNAKPAITVPANCSAPTKLVSKDLTPGTGPEVKNGSALQAHYTLYTFSDKKEQQSSYDAGQPFTLEAVGAGKVIKGWDQGLIGLKQGGRRLLVIPPDLGYGP